MTIFTAELAVRFLARLSRLPLVLEALWMLLRAHLLLKASYPALHREMTIRVAPNPQPPAQDVIRAVVSAVNRACRFYPKSPACLQRSVALTSMLRKRGVAADLQIGVRQFPFGSHAWVEVGGNVINDTPGIREVYPTLHQFKGSNPSQ